MIKYSHVEKIQTKVNDMITYKSDISHYQKQDYWCIPKDSLGDCEDYVLLKRKMLLDEGYSIIDVNIVTCIDETGTGHAVLFVNTDKGGFILDNRQNYPIDPKQLNYTWKTIMREGIWYELRGF